VTTPDTGEQVMPLVAAEVVSEVGFFGRAWLGLKQLLGMA
jgi:D-alanyl-D-alanine carboxypeptidase (penicillin-binding protein 5/6)